MYIEINNHPMPSLNRIWIRSRFTLEPSWIWIWSGQDLEHIWNTGAALPSQWKIQACFPKKNLRRDKPFISQLPTDGSEWTHFGNTEGLWKLLKKKKKKLESLDRTSAYLVVNARLCISLTLDCAHHLFTLWTFQPNAYCIFIFKEQKENVSTSLRSPSTFQWNNTKQNVTLQDIGILLR